MVAHNGYLWMPTPNQKAELDSLILSFLVGVQLAVVITSRVDHGVDVYQVALGAYADSWIPVPQ